MDIAKYTPSSTQAAAGLKSEIATTINSASFGQFTTDGWYGLMSILPNPDPVLRKAGLMETALNDILADPQIFSLVQIRKSAVLSKEWDVDRGKAKSRTAQMIKALLNTYNMPNLITQILDADLYGYQPLEITWGQQGASWLPVNIEAKPREWFSFGIDGTLRFHTKDKPTDGIIVRRWRNFEQMTPDEIRFKFLVPRNSPTYANPYGEAILSRCYWNQFFKKEGKKFWAQFLEIFGSPWVAGEYAQELSSSQDKVDEFLASLQAMAAGRTIAVPEGTKIEFHSPPSGASDSFERFITDARTENAWAILGHSSIAQNTASKLGNDTTELTVADWVISGGVRMVENTLNELIDWVLQINGIQGERPRFILYEEDNVDLTLADRDSKLADKPGVRFSKEYMMRAYGFEEGDIVEVGASAASPAAPKPAPTAAFATDPDIAAQAVLEKYLDTKLSDVKANEEAVSAMFSVVSDYINSKSSYKEAIAGLSGVFADMDESKLETILFSLIGSARMTGYSAAAEDGR